MKGFILLVEDNVQITRGNERMLRRQGYDAVSALTLTEAKSVIEKHMPDVIVLDIMLPDGSGIDFMRELRKTSGVPILLLTGLATPADVMHGLNEGGDDHLAKPYDFGVLLARIEALLRRASQVPETLTRGLLTLNLTSMVAFVAGQNLGLTPKDYALLQFFVQNENHLMGADYIYEKVWGQPMVGDSQALNTIISRLRKKLAGCGYTITAIYRQGYVFERWEP